MKILHVAATAYPAKSYGGPSLSVFQTLRALSRAGVDVSLITTDADGRERLRGDCPEWQGVKVQYCRAWPLNSYGWSAQMVRAMSRMIGTVDVVHCHGVFLASTTFAAWFGRRAGRPVFVSPHGAMMRWARSQKRLKKQLYGLVDRYGLGDAVWHATSVEEQEHVAEVVGPGRVVLVPNGVDLAFYSSPPGSGFRARHGISNGRPVIAWIGRFDPVKNVEVLIQATTGLGVELVLAGDPQTAYGRKVRELAKERRDVHFVGYLNRMEKRQLLHEASVYAHPSIMESYGMSIVEALACSCPVVASDGTPWKQLAEYHAGRCVPASADEFRKALGQILAQGRASYAAGAARVAAENSWDLRAAELIAAYRRRVGTAT